MHIHGLCMKYSRGHIVCVAFFCGHLISSCWSMWSSIYPYFFRVASHMIAQLPVRSTGTKLGNNRNRLRISWDTLPFVTEYPFCHVLCRDVSKQDDMVSDFEVIRSPSLRWCHSERDSVSNCQPYDCLLNRLFRRNSKKFTTDPWITHTKGQ